jgi:hypothetical protein
MLRHRGTSPGRAIGIHPSTYCRWKRQLDRHAPEILAQSPCRNVPLSKIEREEMRFLTPPRSSTWPRPSMPATGHWCSSAPTAACGWESWPGYAEAASICWPRRSPVAETLTELKGKLIAGPPKTRAGGAPSGCRPSSSVSCRHTLPPRSGPAATSSPLPVGRGCGSRAFGRVLGCRLPRRPACRACASTTFATPPWRCGSPPARRPRRSARARGPPRSASPWTATATRRSPSRSRRVGASSKGLDYGARQHGRKPQDARSPG